MTYVLCECSGYNYHGNCKHAKAVRKILDSGGTFSSNEFLITSHTDPRKTYTMRVSWMGVIVRSGMS